MNRRPLTPTLVIAGAPRCGTTSLFDYLAGHPQVCAATEKETRFLIDPTYSLHVPDRSVISQGLDGYAQFFPHHDPSRHRVVVEATPDYLYQRTAQQTLASLEGTTVLFIFRRPSRRILSLYTFAKHVVGAIDADTSFSDYIHAVRSGTIATAAPILRGAIDHSDYAKHLQPWVDRLPPGRMVFRLFEDMAADAPTFMARLAGELGITPDHYATADLGTRNPSVGIRSRRLHALRARHGPWLTRLPGFHRARPVLRRAYEVVQHRATAEQLGDADRALLDELDRELTPANRHLARLTGLDLAAWEDR